MSSTGSPVNRNFLWASTFVEELFRGGVREACISPGSRSTPLTLALAYHPEIKVFTHIDERSGAFFALGHAKVTGRPVVLVCTSGSAAANFHPAIIEASQGQVPLIVLTADRPPHLRDTGAGQTIDQIKLYGGTVRWFFEVGTPDLNAANLRHLRTLAARALFESQRRPGGPVHLNFPFSKPLEPIPAAADPQFERLSEALGGVLPDTAQARPEGPYSRATPPVPTAPPEVLGRIARQVGAAPRGLIACGPMPPPAEGGGNGAWPEAVATLARLTGYPILADPLSQVRCGPHESSHVIAHGEAILRAPAFRKKLLPQVVLRFGAMPTAKHVQVLLGEHPACPVVLVNEAGTWLEPTHNPTEIVCADPAAFCRALAEALAAEKPPRNPAWLAAFQEAEREAAAAIAAQFAQPAPEGLDGEWFEGRVFHELGGLLPQGALLYTANSMPVRDLDAFLPATSTALRFLVNRGANGIDGTLSSALGAAAAHRLSGGAAVVLVTGDLAFYHDANGLLAAAKEGLDLTVILINNDGGGIFEMLPIREFGEPYETHFGTPHGIDFEKLAAAYGVAVQRPGNWEEFRGMVRGSLSVPGTRVVEIRTDRARNRLQHQQVWQAVAARIAAVFPPERQLA